jgi:hypothetical protein
MADDQLRKDMLFLVGREEFRRFLFRVIQTAGILAPTTDGSVDRHLAYDEGRRNLGLDILAMAEAGQPVPHPGGLPVLTLIQVLREEANQQPQENKRGRRNDRYRDLDGDDSDD